MSKKDVLFLSTAVFFGLSIILSQAKAASLAPFDIASGNSMQKIRRDGSDLDKLQFNGRVNIDLAGDESESFQLVVIPNKKTLSSVKVSLEPIKGPGQNLEIKWHLVDYVRTGNTSYAVEYVGWWPDPLLPAKDFNVPVDRVQPLWFTVTAPPSAKPGIYRGSVIIEASHYRKEIPLTVHVRNFTLPRPGKLAAPFGLYMDTIAEWYYGKAKKDGKNADWGAGREGKLKIEDFEKWCRFLTDYRLTPKNIGYEYVEKTYKTLPNGKTVLDTVDMNNLQKTVGKLSDRLSPYGYGLYRLPIARQIPKALKEKDSSFTPEALTESVVKNYEEWKRQGFPDDVYVYGMDEPSDEGVIKFISKTYKLIKEAIPSCKIMQTGVCDDPDLIGLVDIWCPKTDQVENPFFTQRLAEGDSLWTYICCSPVAPYPNLFIDVPATEHRVLFWQSKQIGATGFLLWSTTWWKELGPTAASGEPCFPDVPLDMRHSREYRLQWVHVNGDGILVYPGKNVTPLPSIRLEVVRDGIEDFEYLTLLEELTAKVKNIPIYETHEGATLVRQAEQLCKVPEFILKNANTFTKDPQEIIDQRKKVGDMIEQLINVIEEKDYEKWWNETDDYFNLIE